MAWRALVVGLLVVVFVSVLWRLRLVVLPVFVALLLCAALVPVVTRMERSGVPTLAAAWLTYLGFLAVVVGTFSLIIPTMSAQLTGLGETVSEGLDDVEDWLVRGPLDLDRSDVREVRPDGPGRFSDAVSSSWSTIVSGALVVGEVLAGLLLSLVLGFLFLKDGRRFQRWALEHLPARQHDLASALGQRAWEGLAGYLRGAAILGVVEGAIIGGTLWVLGVPLAAPVGILTFMAAFFPIVGAIAAGAAAVLVTLVAGGTSDALIVLVVAVLVQQLDNDLLAPFIYGRSVQLHPALILIALTAGGVLGGIIGAFLAVPLAAAVSGVTGELWARYGEAWRTRRVDRATPPRSDGVAAGAAAPEVAPVGGGPASI